MQQIFTIALTIFYVGWLCIIAFFLYQIVKAIQKAADAIYQMSEQRKSS